MTGALIKGVPADEEAMATVKGKIIRGVYVRGVPYPEGAIVEMSGYELAELTTANYAVKATEEDLAPPAPPKPKDAKA